jgi:hypothetical protein
MRQTLALRVLLVYDPAQIVGRDLNRRLRKRAHRGGSPRGMETVEEIVDGLAAIYWN